MLAAPLTAPPRGTLWRAIAVVLVVNLLSAPLGLLEFLSEGKQRERGALRAEMSVRRVFTLGHPGHCDKGRVQNLVATAVAALTPSSFAFIFLSSWHNTQVPPSRRHASISTFSPQAEALDRRKSHRCLLYTSPSPRD